jgi:hypothetical protein
MEEAQSIQQPLEGIWLLAALEELGIIDWVREV